MKKTVAVLLFSLFVLSKLVHTQAIEDDKLVIGERFTFKSEIMGEDREIWVYLPANYKQTNQEFPVMYMLDGNGHLLHAAGIVEYLSSITEMPSMILVGILNTDRTRDLTPPTEQDVSERLPTAGKADTFLEFIEKELIPHIESKYRTEDFKLLMGHSFGGLFAVHTLFVKPDLFNGLIAVSPSIWWNNQYYEKELGAFLDNHPDLKTSFFISLGNEADVMVFPYKRFVITLEEKAPETMLWGSAHMPNEDHGSTPHRTIYKAFELFFDGWRMPVEVAEKGLDSIKAYYAKLGERLQYDITPPENVVNLMGYVMMRNNKNNLAVEIMKYNVELYPNSVNVYDSYGEALEAIGEYEKAIENYKIAIEKGEEINDPNLGAYIEHVKRAETAMEENQ